MASLSANLTDNEQDWISPLLPYWGLSLNERKTDISEGMKNCTVLVDGMDADPFHKVSKYLQHTGARIMNSGKADLRCTVDIKHNTSAPLILHAGAMSYTLKPLRKQTDDVQIWIHKRLWLPVHDVELALTLHAREEKNLPEWLSYLVIQHFMRDSFTSLADLTFSEYHHAVATLLRKINPSLAACQLTIEQPAQDEWPEIPPEDRSTVQSQHHSSPQPLNPFSKQNMPTEENPINPFRNQSDKERKTIDPFRKRRF